MGHIVSSLRGLWRTYFPKFMSPISLKQQQQQQPPLDTPGWDRIPNHLSDMILDKLKSTQDFLQFGAVNKRWNCISNDHQIKRIHMERHKQIPMLLIPDKEDEHKWHIYNILDNKFLASKLCVPFNKRFSGSSQGWLVTVNEDTSVTLYKPFSKFTETDCPRIHLPPVTTWEPDPTEGGEDELYRRTHPFHVTKVYVSTDPLENPDECIIVITYAPCDEAKLFRLGKDSTWIMVDVPGSVQDIIHYKNQIYFLAYYGDLYLCESSNLTTVKFVAPKTQQDTKYVKRYIVESKDGKLLQVMRHMDFLYNPKGRNTTSFQIYQLDFDTKEWGEITSLDGDALFLGDNSSIRVEAYNFNGCRENCIYFTDDYDHKREGLPPPVSDLGIYDVQTKEFEWKFSLNSTIFETFIIRGRRPLWIVPTFDRY